MTKIKILITTFLISGFFIIPFVGAESFFNPITRSGLVSLSAENNLLPSVTKIYLIEIKEEIKAGTYQYLKRVINKAERSEADYLVIKLDTPGGLLKATKDIVDLILATPIETIVFVSREGGWAFSAGTFILMAADLAVVHPGASIGAAQPRSIMGEAMEVDEKMLEGVASWIRTLAGIHQRSPEIAEKFVRENLTLTGQEAKELAIIDETAKSLDELFLKLDILSPEIREISPNFIEKLFNFLSHPYLVSLLLSIGGLAIVMAIRAGEFELTGAIGISALLIGLWGIGVITFSFLGIGLLLLGLLLLMMEVFIEPGFGIFGISGTIIIVIGIFTFGAEPFLFIELWDPVKMVILGAALAICVFFVILGRGVSKSVKNKSVTGSESLIGLRVEVIKELNPYGQVKVGWEVWSAKTLDQEIISKKKKVEIIKVEGNTLIVKD